jgi:hypothetical protein
LHGRGIFIWGEARIYIGYWEDGDYSPGPYFRVFLDNWFRVGELYMKNGVRWKRGTQYNQDGTEEQYDQEWDS